MDKPTEMLRIENLVYEIKEALYDAYMEFPTVKEETMDEVLHIPDRLEALSNYLSSNVFVLTELLEDWKEASGEEGEDENE